MELNKIYQGNCLTVLKSFPEKIVDCVTTSPPYWNLRNYNTEDQIWDTKENCEHEWIETTHRIGTAMIGMNERIQKEKNNLDGKFVEAEFERPKEVSTGFCSKCGAWRGSFGLEPTYHLYIQHLCDIFDEVKRILKDSGTLWVNLGDTYNSHPANSKNVGGFEGEQMRNNPAYRDAKVIGKRNVDLPDKCLIQIPARFAIEMANRGWILRNEIIWYKRNCMPSSVMDRFTVDFERIYFFVKQKKYWFEPQYEPHTWKDKDNLSLIGKKCKMDGAYNCAINWKGRARAERYGEFGRNKRCVWDITTKPFREAHFATFPEALIETPIKAGCPEMICSKCHQARKKIYQKKEYIGPEKEITGKYANSEVHSAGAREHYLSEQRKFTPDQKAVAKFIKGHITSKYHLGVLDNEFGKTTWEHWIRTDNSGACLPSPEDYRKLKGILELSADYDEAMLTTVKVLVDDKGCKDECMGYSDCGCGAEWIPGVVLDPFMGSGTTGVVAKKLKRSYVGIELNPEYIEMANRRINGTE